MRIRTVKPAFWANEKMSLLPDFARLLAIGLLNYSDDHGFFWANSLMIRGSLFPFEEDASKVRKGLAQLECEGFVRLGKTPDGREVGHVINFSKHQRVDKANPSEIQPIAQFDERSIQIQDDSKNDPRMFQERSLLDRKGMEGKGKEGGATLPLPFSSEAFKAVWIGWIEYRKEMKLPNYTKRSLAAQFKALSDWGESCACASIEASIRNQWQGLFPDKRQPAVKIDKPRIAENFHASAEPETGDFPI